MDILPSAPRSFRFDDSHQERIYQQLKIIGPGPAAFFKDACRVMASDSPIDSVTHIVAHCMREIESALRVGVLRPVALTGSDENSQFAPSRREQVQAILSELGVSPQHDISKLWNRLDDLAAKAHRAGLTGPRPMDGAFRQWWSDIQLVLDFVLGRIAERFFTYHERLDEILRTERPSKQEIKRLQEEIPHNNVTLGYFFNRAGPEWLDPLGNSSLFKYPPPPVVENERTVTFSPWPASQYLLRMATTPSAQNRVAEIALGIPATENTRVHEDLAGVACALPPELASKFVEQAVQWLGTPFKILLPEKLGRLVSLLTTGETIRKAIELARALFEVFPDPKFEATSADERSRLLLPEPRGHVDDYEYEHLLTGCRDDLVHAAPDESLDIFCELLARAIQMSFPDSEPPDDHSTWWRPTVATGESRQGGDIKDSLTAAVCIAARAIVESDESRISQVVETLERHRWRIFLRIALWLIGEFPGERGEGLRHRLLEQYGEIEPSHSERPKVEASWGYRSPRISDELRAMETKDLIEFLKTWKSENQWDGPSAEGLSENLRIAILTDPHRYSREAAMFIGVSAQYVSSVLGAFETAVNQKKAKVEWEELLSMCRWVVDRNRPRPGVFPRRVG